MFRRMDSSRPAEQAAVDRAMMQRCIALAVRSAKLGEYPYAAIICRGGDIVCESINPVTRDRDVTHHAETVAISQAQRILDTVSLDECTLYGNAEPCAYCCYAIRESRIRRVVYGMQAPVTGGVTRWNILTDTGLSDAVPEVFAPPPEIVAGFMREEAENAIAHANPIAWEVIRSRRIFGGPLPPSVLARTQAPRPESAQTRLMAFLRRTVFDYFGRK